MHVYVYVKTLISVCVGGYVWCDRPIMTAMDFNFTYILISFPECGKLPPPAPACREYLT